MEGKEAMVFHGNKWGWRAIAARLLLTPVLAAGVAAPAFAQKAPSSPTTRSAPAARSGEPKDLLKMGREALKAGQFDRAQDLARQADAANPSGRWGLFDDTPESLEKDIRSARAKADRAEAEKLTRAAKDLMAKPARTPGEKMANLDQAYHMADRAVALYGSSDFLDNLFGGDRPDEVRKAIDAARAQLRKTAPASALAKAPAAAPAKGGSRPGSSFFNPPAGAGGVQQVANQAKPGAPSNVMPAGGLPAPKIPASPAQPPASAAADPSPAKAHAVKMVAEGRALLKQGQPAEAKAKAIDAMKLRASYAPNDDTPDALLRDAMAAGKAKVDALVREGEAHLARQDVARADASLHNASVVAASFGFPTKAIDEKLAAVRAANPAPMTTAPVVVADAKPSAPVVPAVEVPEVKPPAAPVASGGLKEPAGLKAPSVTVETAPMPVAKAPAKPAAGPAGLPGLVAPPPVAKAPAKPQGLSGAEILARAEAELQRGELEMARKLAIQAHNADESAKADAQAMLRAIEAARGAREQKAAAAALKNAADLCQANQHEQALGVLRLLDVQTMTPEQKAEHAKLTSVCSDETAKLKAPVTTVAANDPPKPAAPSVADQARALTEVEFQKFRSDGLDTEAKARDAFNRGETDLAIQMLTDFTARVKGSSLTTARQGLLLGPVERRLESFRIMKRQIDFYTKEAKDKQEIRELVAGKSLAEQQKREEIGKKVREVNDLVKAHKYKEAESLALQIKSMDPDDPTLNAIYEMARRNRRWDDAQKLKSDKEAMVLAGLNGGEKMGPYADIDNPLVHDVERSLQSLRRTGTDDVYIRTRTPAEREIELRLKQPLSVEFSQTPIREVISKLREQTGLNMSIDDASITEEALPIDTVTVTDSLKDTALEDVLAIILEKARLKYVIRNNVISITTEKKAKGQLVTKVFSVMDLVTPIPDFALAPHMTFAAAAAKAGAAPGGIPGSGGATIQTPASGLQNGQLVSGPNNWAGGGAGAGGGFTPSGGTLDNRNSPLAGGAHLAPVGRQNASAQLIKLITGMVRPYSWQELNGPGKIDYYDIGGALVVNQTADVIREVQDLLESLRRLQETSVAVEIRVISLSEAFFERVGVDFQMNISTLSNDRKGFERALTTGMFRPEPYINSIDGVGDGLAVGWNPQQGGFTPDLNVPIRPNTYGLGVPPFGGYPGPGNGGLNVGLAFLNDIQVYMFLEAAQGDRRINIMQAPKVTLFNGQTSTVFVSDVAFFTLGLQVFNVGGQTIYQPINTPVPIGTQFNPNTTSGAGFGGPGVSVTVQAIVSADRRFVRLNLAPTLTSLTSAVVPLFPVTAFITPVFEGGSQGVPIPFTQFFQQPSISEISVQTTVAVPDGGTVVLGGLKTLAEGRNEFGPPVLSNIPYLNRLFRNHGIGRETRHIMIMVTPRIIIQSEEEFNQTQISGPPVAGIGGSGS